jgi:DNA-binding MarR family transcriptional regulator
MRGMSDVVAAELSDLELAAWRGFLRTHAELFKALDAQLESAHGLPLTTYEVLTALLHAPGSRLRMAELASQSFLSRSGVTRLVDRLERDGLLRRDQCSSDARGCFAVLTPKGEELLRAARPTHLDGVRQLFLSRLSDDDLRTLARVWDLIDGD